MYQMVPTSKLLSVSYLRDMTMVVWDELSMRGDLADQNHGSFAVGNTRI